jgi:signal transduction histidine kinase
MGIGLSICRLIAEELGGKVVLDTDYKGGARFVFTLPMER